MDWFALSIIAYFLIALEVILDKFLISSERVSHPAVYAFYSGVMSLFAFVFFPFGFHLIYYLSVILNLLAGIIFVYGILSLFFAIKGSEASRVTPVVGAIIPIVTYLLSIFFLEEKLGVMEVIGVVILILGGIWISLNIYEKSLKKFFKGFYPSILSGILLAISFTMFKYCYDSDNFINVYIWTRFGVMFGALSLLFHKKWRKLIFGSIFKFKKPSVENKSSGAVFVSNKALGGMGSIIKEYATSIGSVTIVNALISIEYVFIFILGLIFSYWMPIAFSEKKDIRSVFQKITAIIIISIGVALVSISK